MHKASKYVVDLAEQYNVKRVVIGYNAGWKQEINLGDTTNQNFTAIPYLSFIEKCRYKLENIGVELVVTEESYTSKTSFISGEFPQESDNYFGKRQYRGLYIDQSGQKINADVNGSYQILKKVFPNAYADGIEGLSLHPVRVNVSGLRKSRDTLIN